MEKGRSLPFAGLALPLAAELIDASASVAAAAADNDDYDDDACSFTAIRTSNFRLLVLD